MTTLSAEDLALFKNIDFGIAQNAVNSLLATIEELRRQNADQARVYHDTQWRQLKEAEAEVSRLRASLNWALPLAAIAVEDHRCERLRHGHNDIKTHTEDGSVILGLWQNEYDDLRAAKAALSPPGGTDK